MKHLFQSVPAGSSNKTVRVSYSKMSARDWVWPMLLMIALLAVSPLAADASPASSTVAAVRHIYVAPGGSFTVEGGAEPGLNVTVYLTGTNNDTHVYTYTVPSSGLYKYTVTLPQSMTADVYRVTVETDSVLRETLMVTVSSTDKNQVAAQLLQSTLNTLKGLKAYVAELESRGYNVPPRALEGVEKAEQALQEAKMLLDAVKTQESWAKVKEAQEILRASLQAINQPERPPDVEPPTAAMNQTLARAREYFRKLSLSVESLRKRGWDTSSLEDTLKEIRLLLEDAEHQYRNGDQRGFESVMRQASQRMKDAQALVNAEMNRVKVILASKYRESVQRRVTNLRESLSAYQTAISILERNRVTYALTLTEGKLALLQQRLAAGELDMEKLADVSDDIKVALQNISNEDVRRALEEMNRVKARVDTLTQSGESQDEDTADTIQSRLQAETLRLRRIREYLLSLSSQVKKP